MGTCQSTETTYMFGFLNLQVTHMDLFSLLLGVGITIGTLYVVRCCKTHTKIKKHILGAPTPKWGPYPAQIIPQSCHHNNAPSAPQPPTTQTSQLAVPWHIIWRQNPAMKCIVNEIWTKSRWRIGHAAMWQNLLINSIWDQIGHFYNYIPWSNLYHVWFYALIKSIYSTDLIYFLQIWHIYSLCFDIATWPLSRCESSSVFDIE